MNWLTALILGIIQGLTEFLPVSSSGHLELGKAVLDDIPEEGMLMTVVLHFATALSTIVIFRKDIIEIIKGLFQFKNNEQTRFSIMIILSMIPAALVGVLFEDQIDAFFSGNLLLVGFMLMLTGGLLFLADRAKNTEGKVTISKAIIIGISQAIAILPGISRSGATIGTSVLLGIDKTRAARFSFLMVVPLIFGAMAVKTKKYLEIQDLEKADLEARTEMIISEMEEEIGFEITKSEDFHVAVLEKERSWDLIKKEDYSGELTSENIEKTYIENLKTANIGDAQLETVLENDFAKVRPHQSTPMGSIIIGFLAAFITGLLACTWMIALVKKSKLVYFSIYCFIVGIAAVVLNF